MLDYAVDLHCCRPKRGSGKYHVQGFYSMYQRTDLSPALLRFLKQRKYDTPCRTPTSASPLPKATVVPFRRGQTFFECQINQNVAICLRVDWYS